MKISIMATGCEHLLCGSGYHRGQSFDGDLDAAFKVARDLFDHGLDVMVTRPRFPLREVVDSNLQNDIEHKHWIAIWVVDVNWLERA